MDEFIELVASPYRAEITNLGAGLSRLSYEDKPLVRFPQSQPYADINGVVMSAGALLAPWPNRVADGTYSFGGSLYQLPINEAGRHNALHGLVRNRLWRHLDNGNNRAETSFGFICEASSGWGWRMNYEVTWSLNTVTGLSAKFSVTNLSQTPCPFGFGWHPYLSALGSPLDECQMSLPVKTYLPLDNRGLPAGVEVPAEHIVPQVTQGINLAGILLDHAFRVDTDEENASTPTHHANHCSTPGNLKFAADDSWEDTALQCSLTRLSDGKGVCLTAGRWARWLQVYTADPNLGGGFPGANQAERALALEPMSCPPDMLRSGTDLIEIPAGGSKTFDFGIRAI